MPGDTIAVDLDGGTASMRESQLRMKDFFNVVNALTDGAVSGPPARASVSFQVHWDQTGAIAHIDDDEGAFTAHLAEATSSMRWRATSQGIRYRSVGESENEFAVFGRERAGVFRD